jgi:CDGSH-type Zn-finger protein
MAREVTHTERGPYRLTADDIDETYGDVAICQCGLSADPPFCDGTHRRTEDEAEGVRYKYVDGQRHVVRVVSADEGAVLSGPEYADADADDGAGPTPADSTDDDTDADG